MLNTVSLQGRLGRDPELHHTQSGVAYTTFSLAVDQDRKGQDGKYPTDWISVVAWRQMAEHICKYWCQGKQMLVTGRLATSSYTDKESNQRIYRTQVVADKVHFCGDRQASGSAPAKPQQYQQSQDFTELPDDDGELPF